MGNGSEWEPERVTDKMTTPGPPKIPLSYRSGIRTFWAIFGLNAVRNPDILTQNPGQGRS